MIADNTIDQINSDLIFRLRERARIRRQISTRKSVQEGKPDRISDLLEEAADELETSTKKLKYSNFMWDLVKKQYDELRESSDSSFLKINQLENEKLTITLKVADGKNL